jgi:leucyl aminopeptidase
MLRAALLTFVLAGSMTRGAAAEPVFISTGSDALGAITATASRAEILSADDDVAVMQMEETELEAIAHELHERTGRCGGFIVHDSLEDAMASMSKPGKRPPIEYTIDRPQTVRAVLADLDREQLLGTIRELSAMPDRLYKSAHGAAASTWLRDRWAKYAGGTDVTIELVDHGYPQKSVVLTIPGSTRADEVVVIGGHLDSITFGGRQGGAPGADDDASGIATLSEVLRALLANEYHPERTLVFVAYAAEEIGLRGSQGVVKLFQQRGINVVGALQLDMTNYRGSDKDIWLMKDFTSAPQNEFLIKLIETYVGATWGLDACGYACSDHASWYRAGVPASMPFEARMRDRNMSIHSARDTLETSGNNADHAIKFAQLAAAYAVELGKGDFMSKRETPVPTPAHEPGCPTSKLLVLGILAALAGAALWVGRLVR